MGGHRATRQEAPPRPPEGGRAEWRSCPGVGDAITFLPRLVLALPGSPLNQAWDPALSESLPQDVNSLDFRNV